MGGSSKKVTVGYKYYLGMHMILCHGPIDFLTRISVDKRPAWKGRKADGTINIRAEGLFGGEEREGGVSGAVNIELGRPSQARNSYLQGQLGADIPAYRGVVGAVLRQCYLGMNPYLKAWSFRAQRVHTRQDGLVQWYDAKAQIGSLWELPQAIFISLDVSGSMTTVMSNGNTRLQNAQIAIAAALDYIDELRQDSGHKLYISGVAWADSYANQVYLNANTSHINSLKTWFNERTAGGGTDFRQGVASADAFFDLVPSDAIRTVIFITDGVPGVAPEGGDSELITTEAAATLFSIPDVWSYAINIDLEDTQYTSQLDNSHMDGVPVVSGDDPQALLDAITVALGGQADMNPAHIIRECLTDPDWGMEYQDSDIDDMSFTSAANVLWAEKMGISLLWDRQTPLESFVGEIVKHIDAALYVSRTTGKFVLKLIRKDYDEETLILLDESNVVNVDNPTKPTFGELNNSVTVNYWSAETGADASVTVTDTAMVQMQGSVINTTVQYPGFTNATIATLAAQRDLRSLSSSLLSCTIYADQTAKDLNIGDTFKFSWSRWNVDSLVMRVTGIAFGDGKTNQVRITCTQDVFDTPSVSVIAEPGTGWVDPINTPEPCPVHMAFEAPYYEAVQRLGQDVVDTALASSPEVGYLLAAGGRPSSDAVNMRMFLDSGAGYEDTITIDFSPFAYLSADVSRTDISFSIRDWQDIDLVDIGTHAQIGNELIRIDAIDTVLGTITVGRGVLDTIPEIHLENAPILFHDVYAESNAVQYVDGETVDVKLLPVTGMGQLGIDLAPSDALTFDSRAIRPFPPANVQIKGDYFPEAKNSPLTVTWAERNRVQQTGGALLDWFDGSITPEAGVTYDVTLKRVDNGSTLDSGTDLTTTSKVLTSSYNGIVELLLRAKRDGHINWQDFVHQFQLGVVLPAVAPELRGTAVSYTTSSVTSFNATLPAGIVSGDLIVLILHRLSNNFAARPTGYYFMGSASSFNGTTVDSTTTIICRVADGSEGTSQTVTAATAGPFMVTSVVFKTGTYTKPRGATFSYTVASGYETRNRGASGSSYSITNTSAPHDEYYPPWRGKHSALMSVLNRRLSNNDPSGPYSGFSIRVGVDSAGVPESFVNGDITGATLPTLPLLPAAYTKASSSDYSNVLNMAIRGVFNPTEPECYPIIISGTNATAATSFAINRSAESVTVKPGELEICVLQMFGASGVTITPPSGAGWTLVQRYGSRLSIYKRVTTGSEGTSETWTFSSSLVCMAAIWAFPVGSFDSSGDVLSACTAGSATSTYNLPAVTGDAGWASKNNFLINVLVREGAAGLAAGNPATWPTHAPEFRTYSFTQASVGAQVSFVHCGGMINAQNAPSGTITSSSSYAYESASIFIKGI